MADKVVLNQLADRLGTFLQAEMQLSPEVYSLGGVAHLLGQQLSKRLQHSNSTTTSNNNPSPPAAVLLIDRASLF